MKRYVLLAGVNGSGKTTLYSLISSLENIESVNFDDTVREFGDWRNAEAIVKAGKTTITRINKYFNDGISFSQETTLCGRSILNNIKKAKTLGYNIEMHYVGLDSPIIAQERVENRVRKGGHGIPKEDIIRRYYSSLNNFKIVFTQCNLVAVYDNTQYFRRFAIYKSGICVRKSNQIPEWYHSIMETQ